MRFAIKDILSTFRIIIIIVVIFKTTKFLQGILLLMSFFVGAECLAQEPSNNQGFTSNETALTNNTINSVEVRETWTEEKWRHLREKQVWASWQGRYKDSADSLRHLVDQSTYQYGIGDESTLFYKGNLAYTLGFRLGQFQEAEKLYLQVIHWRSINHGDNHYKTLHLRKLLADLYYSEGQYGIAVPIYLGVIESYKVNAQQNHEDARSTMFSLGVAYRELGEFAEAENILTKLLHQTEVQDGPLHPNTVIAYSGLSTLLIETDKNIEAISLLQPFLERIAASISRGDVPSEFSTIRYKLAIALRNVGEFEESEKQFQSIVDVEQVEYVVQTSLPPHFYIEKGELYKLQGRYKEAESLFRKALQDLGIRNIIGLKSNVKVNYSLGSLYLDNLNQPDLGIFYLKQAVNVLQSMRANIANLESASQRAFLQKNRITYESLQSALIDQGRFAEAALVGRMLKEQEFYDFIRRRSSEEGDPRQTVIAFTASEQDWASRMEDWRERPNRMAREYQALFEARQNAKITNAAWSDQDEARLQEASVSLGEANSAFRAKVDELTNELTERAAEQDGQVSREIAELNLKAAQSYRRMLSDNGPTTALVQMISLTEATHLLFITSEAVVHEEVNLGRDELNKLIFAARNTPGIGEPFKNGAADIADIQNQLGELYDILIKPIKTHMDDISAEVLLIDAQGAIRYVPFAALYDGQNYLGETHLIALHNGAAQTDYNRLAPDFTQASAFGVTQAHKGFVALPNVKDEIEALIPGDDNQGIIAGTGLLDNDFTRASLEDNLGQGQILHVATHYRMNPGNEINSQLLLGDGSFMTPADIRDSEAFIRRLNQVDLVALSACETALTDQGIGAEVEGLGNIMQLNGANTVIATLWAVADESTAEFMTTFYTSLIDEKLTKAKAMQTAQKQMMQSKDHAAPYYWAPYIIMGNWR